MTKHERTINQDLRTLDEAHRLGWVSRAEYRARRRRVLGMQYDSGVTTVRRTLATLLSRRPEVIRGSQAVVLAGVAALVLLACWMLLRK